MPRMVVTFYSKGPKHWDVFALQVGPRLHYSRDGDNKQVSPSPSIWYKSFQEGENVIAIVTAESVIVGLAAGLWSGYRQREG